MKKIAILCVFGLAYSGISYSQDKPAPIYNTKHPVMDKVVSEELYTFAIRTYDPPVRIKPVKQNDASYDVPEQAAIAQISAMLAKDFSWFRNTWTKESKIIMENDDKKNNFNKDFWVNAWAKAFRDKDVDLLNYIETGEYVIISYRFVSKNKIADSSEKDMELDTVLKREDGKWLATQELAQDPVLLYWRSPETRVKRVKR